MARRINNISVRNFNVEKKMKKILLSIPLLSVILITTILSYFLLQNKNPNKPPSALLNKELPIFETSDLFNKKNFLNNSDINKSKSLINFFASWCIPCKAEHELFFELKKIQPKLLIVGINHKDKENDAINFLNENGNPYDFVGIDKNGKIAFEFGVFGLPETFITNNEGKIIYKYIGPLNKKIIKNEIIPLL